MDITYRPRKMDETAPTSQGFEDLKGLLLGQWYPGPWWYAFIPFLQPSQATVFIDEGRVFSYNLMEGIPSAPKRVELPPTETSSLLDVQIYNNGPNYAYLLTGNKSFKLFWR